MLLFLLLIIAIVSLLWAFWSLRDLKAPTNFYPQFAKKVRRVLSGVIDLPKK